MIKLDGNTVKISRFPDGTQLLKIPIIRNFNTYVEHTIEWFYEGDNELITLINLVGHIRDNDDGCIFLKMPYIPNARQDRVKNDEDVFTLKYFSEVINSLKFCSVSVLDPHSSVSVALIDRVISFTPERYIYKAISMINSSYLAVFYPDEGSVKRYSEMLNMRYTFGVKSRDWSTGAVNGLDIVGDADVIKGKDILIVDDICSRGGTFYHSAKKLKELGANRIYLFVTHCENTILEGELLKSGLIETVFTTNSIFTRSHEMVKVLEL